MAVGHGILDTPPTVAHQSPGFASANELANPGFGRRPPAHLQPLTLRQGTRLGSVSSKIQVLSPLTLWLLKRWRELITGR